MASEKQLQSWLKKAQEKVERFGEEKAELETEIYKLNKKLATCNKHLLEAEDLVLKYQNSLDQMDPSKVPAAAPVIEKLKIPAVVPVTEKEEQTPEIGVNGWPMTFIKLLDVWLQGRTSWNHEEWTELLNRILETEHAILVKTHTLEIGQYLESHRSLE